MKYCFEVLSFWCSPFSLRPPLLIHTLKTVSSFDFFFVLFLLSFFFLPQEENLNLNLKISIRFYVRGEKKIGSPYAKNIPPIFWKIFPISTFLILTSPPPPPRLRSYLISFLSAFFLKKFFF